MNEAFTFFEILLAVIIILPLGFIDYFIAYLKKRKEHIDALYWAEMRALRHGWTESDSNLKTDKEV